MPSNEVYAIVHLSVGAPGRSYYSTLCGIDAETEWVTFNDINVTCEACLEKNKYNRGKK